MHHAHRRTPVRLAAACTTLVLLAPAGAAAQDTAPASWTCRASALEAQVSNQSRVTPLVSDRTPCADGLVGVPNVGTATGLAPGVTAKTAYGVTGAAPPGAFPIKQTVTSDAGVEGLQMTIIPGLDLSVDAARAQAGAACLNGAPNLVGTSTVAALKINGQEIKLDGLLTSIVDPLSSSPLGAVVQVRLNEQIKDATGLTQRAAHVIVLSGVGADATALADVVVAESRVATSNACDPNARGNSDTLDPGQLGQLCPSGSTLDVARSVCVIAATASGGMGEIVVGPPKEGPSGGSVLALDVARDRYTSPCLEGPGPQFAIVGTNGADRVTGTNVADRILGLGGNDAIAGGRDDDCLDGGNGSDNLSGSIGNDRIYGLTGKDHLNGGPGLDHLFGGIGNDSINTAFGADVVDGGPGVDYINAATAGKPARITCGSGRDKVRVNRNEMTRLRGCEVRYVIR